MDRSKRREEWQRAGDIAYAVAVGLGAQLPRDAFDRFAQNEKQNSRPTVTKKPSEL